MKGAREDFLEKIFFEVEKKKIACSLKFCANVGPGGETGRVAQ
jgi:hypothetical protein